MTTGVLCPQPILQFFLPNGLPNAGGSVLTTVGGVNTATYQDVGLATPLPNPIPLNSFGQPSNAAGQTQQVFLTPNTVYTFTIYNAAGNQINQATYVDGIQVTGPTQAQIAQLLYPQTPAEVAASVTPTNYLYPELNVLRYGATGNGTSDDTAAINQAVSVASKKAEWSPHLSLTFNAAVYLPTGWYLVGSTGTYISYGVSPVYWVGDGPQASMIINGSTNQPAINCDGGSGGQFYGGFRNLGFGQAAGVTAVAGNSAITLNHYSEFFLSNIGFYNYPQGCYNNLVLNFCQQFLISDVESQGALNVGILVGETGAGQGCSYGAFVNCHSDDCTYGWRLGQAHDCAFTNCGAIASVTSGFYLASASPSSAPNINCRFVNCMVDSSGGHNWWITDAVGCVWSACWGSTQKAGGSAQGAGFEVQTVNSHSLSFSDCIAANNNGNGFELLDTGSSAPTFVNFTNCHSGYQGLGNGQSGTGYGYSISATCHSVRILSGEIQSNATGPINFNGANTGSQDIIYRDIINYQNTDEGTGTVAISSSSVTVTHAANLNPAALSCVQVTPTSSLAASGLSSYWVSAVTGTNFTVTTNTNASGAAFTFAWRVNANNC